MAIDCARWCKCACPYMFFVVVFVVVFLFVFVIIVTACGRYIVDRFNRYRGNKTTEVAEKDK